MPASDALTGEKSAVADLALQFIQVGQAVLQGRVSGEQLAEGLSQPPQGRDDQEGVDGVGLAGDRLAGRRALLILIRALRRLAGASVR